MGPTAHRHAAAAAVITAATLLAACGSTPKTTPQNHAADSTPEQAPAADLLAQAAIDLEAAFAERRAAPSVEPLPGPDTAAASTPDNSGLQVEAIDAEVEPAPQQEPVAATDAAPAPPPQPPPAPEVVIADLTGRIAQILGDDLRPEEEPLRQAARLLALELLSPGSAGPELRALEDGMLPPQREALEALRALFGELADNSTLDQPRLADLLQRQIDALPRARPLAIAELRLCSEVDGFGRYTPMPATFAAGRSHAALVYVEVENFRERRYDSARDGWTGIEDPTAERWVAQLGQEVALLDDRNDHVALHEPEQVVRDIARRRRRDFYIVQRIHLPAQLAIGRYHLKVTIRDLVDGAAVAERIIPIEITAR